ncbi:hypothetical protein GGQ97_000947 [Sphingomonas kaistensis]|uniref:Peptidase M1 membrane alanine aminopeptidase domain-containing protein n=1 Tax=Sphingomonas kaistensis TaxID=298708 RepID=A0A7X6BF90_9SPHN|nr:M1 family aminopeptidase [Sphingomonas kaistensis]NJC05154.1 hypothetical protein [Sphingomonas kaistensis]
MILAAAAALAAAASSDAPADVSVTRRGDGGFEAIYTLPRAAPAWGFFRSSLAAEDRQPWRPRSWTVLTPGVRLERRGAYDALVATDGGPVPRTVRVRVAPYTSELLSDYVPALRLGEDGIALFDGQFSLFSVATPAALARLGPDPEAGPIIDTSTRVRFRGGGASQLRLAGDTAGYRRGNSAGTYGLFGVPGAVEQGGMATVVDPQMPAWLAADIRTFTPRLLDHYRKLLGSPGDLRPTVLASWAGADKQGASLNGGVLKGLVLMRISGAAATRPSPPLRTLAHRYIAHESAHFWLGQMVTYDKAADNWIVEGGADLLAIRALGATEPGYDMRAALQKSLTDCLAASKLGGLSSAAQRQDFQVKYDCGAILSLVAEKVAGGDFPAFVRRLIAANAGDGAVSTEEWLALLESHAAGRNLATRIRPLLNQAQPTARGWTELLTAAGIRYRLRPDQTPELL